jgi:hypothetical protein
MTARPRPRTRQSKLSFIASLTAVGALFGLSSALSAQPDPAANAGFDTYIRALESRLAEQHSTLDGFLAPLNLPDADARLHKGEFLIENLTPNPSPELPGALLFHWRGSAFFVTSTPIRSTSLRRSFKPPSSLRTATIW